MQFRYQYRLYPDGEQCLALARLFGCVRVVFNDALARIVPVKASNKLLGSPRRRVAEGPYQRVPKNTELAKELITQAKQTPEREWLSEVSQVPLQQTLRETLARSGPGLESARGLQIRTTPRSQGGGTTVQVAA